MSFAISCPDSSTVPKKKLNTMNLVLFNSFFITALHTIRLSTKKERRLLVMLLNHPSTFPFPPSPQPNKQTNTHSTPTSHHLLLHIHLWPQPTSQNPPTMPAPSADFTCGHSATPPPLPYAANLCNAHPLRRRGQPDLFHHPCRHCDLDRTISEVDQIIALYDPDIRRLEDEVRRLEEHATDPEDVARARMEWEAHQRFKEEDVRWQWEVWERRWGWR